MRYLTNSEKVNPIIILETCDALCRIPSIQYDLDAYAIANAARRIALERVIMEMGDVLSVNDALFLSWSPELSNGVRLYGRSY